MNCNQIKSNLPEPTPCENRLPGVERMLFIPRQDIESINALSAVTPTTYDEVVIIGSPEMQQKAITVQTGCEFAEIYCAYEMGELTYEPQGQKGSRSLKASLEVFHPGMKAQLLGYMSVAINMEWVLLVGLADGTWHLLGDLRRGAKLVDGTKATSGKAVTDANGGELHFEYSCPKPRVFFRGWDPHDETNGVEWWRIVNLLCTEDDYYLTTEDDELIEVTIY